MSLESSPRIGSCLVGIIPIYSNYIIHSLFLCVNSTNTHISLSHTVHNREIWAICKRYLKGWYAGCAPGIWGLVPSGYVNSPPAPIKRVTDRLPLYALFYHPPTLNAPPSSRCPGFRRSQQKQTHHRRCELLDASRLSTGACRRC